ncbi:MAG: tRNA preQ1(34) S-adenosylmethionine ribosyltransferase-isomerase QueA [Oscillospiraceae bacterium]
MKKSDFYYDLPQELIAQTPLERRDSSRLMKIERTSGNIEHRHFFDICDYLKKGDLLVLNDSKVFPARVYGIKQTTGAVIETLLLKRLEKDVWEILVKPGRKAGIGTKISFGDGLLECEIIDIVEDGNRLARFSYEGEFYSVLDKVGQVPLPHYITAELKDRDRYQTVYSREIGSSAAPTAGLHFTPELLEKIKQMGVNIAYVTLHVGLGTFRPVKVDEIQDHKMHSEHYTLSAETADMINKTKQNGGRVIAVGTTSCRTLESAARYAENGLIKSMEEDTNIFIYPGYEFKVIDGLITNFHLPESTLIMLVSAFLGYEKTMNAYKTAIEEKYRFYSFGDSMLVI